MASVKSLVTGLICALCMSAIEKVGAESVSVHFAHRLSLPSQPVKAVVAVSDSDKLLTIVPAEAIAEDGGKVTVVGEVILSRAVGPLSVLFTLYGKTGEVVSEKLEISPFFRNQELLMDVPHVKNWAADQKMALKKLENEAQAQRTHLQQLQKGAKGREGAVQVSSDLAPISTDDLEGMSSSIKFVQERLSAVKSGNLPPNYKRREAELSVYLNVLSTELKIAQNGGGDLLSDASKEMVEKRELIEATKDEHIDLLQEELARIRKQREAAERR